jgi:hypothetical protein
MTFGVNASFIFDFPQKAHNALLICKSKDNRLLKPIVTFQRWIPDTPPNSLKYSNANPKVKIMEEEGVGVCSSQLFMLIYTNQTIS